MSAAWGSASRTQSTRRQHGGDGLGIIRSQAGHASVVDRMSGKPAQDRAVPPLGRCCAALRCASDRAWAIEGIVGWGWGLKCRSPRTAVSCTIAAGRMAKVREEGPEIDVGVRWDGGNIGELDIQRLDAS